MYYNYSFLHGFIINLRQFICYDKLFIIPIEKRAHEFRPKRTEICKNGEKNGAIFFSSSKSCKICRDCTQNTLSSYTAHSPLPTSVLCLLFFVFLKMSQIFQMHFQARQLYFNHRWKISLLNLVETAGNWHKYVRANVEQFFFAIGMLQPKLSTGTPSTLSIAMSI